MMTVIDNTELWASHGLTVNWIPVYSSWTEKLSCSSGLVASCIICQTETNVSHFMFLLSAVVFLTRLKSPHEELDHYNYLLLIIDDVSSDLWLNLFCNTHQFISTLLSHSTCNHPASSSSSWWCSCSLQWASDPASVPVVVSGRQMCALICCCWYWSDFTAIWAHFLPHKLSAAQCS